MYEKRERRVVVAARYSGIRVILLSTHMDCPRLCIVPAIKCRPLFIAQGLGWRAGVRAFVRAPRLLLYHDRPLPSSLTILENI